MKNILIATILAVTLTIAVTVNVSYAQANPLIYTEVIEVPNITKETLFQRANIWAASAFKDAKTDIQINDKESGQIIGKSYFKYNQEFFLGSTRTSGFISLVFKIFIKEGKYKYEFSEFVHDASLSKGNRKDFGLITDNKECTMEVGVLEVSIWYQKVWDDIKKQIEHEIMNNKVPNLKEAMTNKGTTNNDNW